MSIPFSKTYKVQPYLSRSRRCPPYSIPTKLTKIRMSNEFNYFTTYFNVGYALLSASSPTRNPSAPPVAL